VTLLLDEIWPAMIAEQLRLRGYDVVAVSERLDLRTKSDEVIFHAARAEGRAVVSENAADYRRLARQRAHLGQQHAGIILTSNRRFPRHDKRTIGRLVASLDGLLSTTVDATNGEIWLR
jgi:predicted nuclease of predicted toxin-antitoxin system